MAREQKSRTAKLPEQSEKFISAARSLACDESEEHFDTALAKVAAHKATADPKGGKKFVSEKRGKRPS
jgi:hypothetical protein